MSNVSELLAERSQIRADLLAHKIPKRVPVYAGFTLSAACGYAGTSYMEAHYNPELREQAFDAICRDFYADAVPVSDLRLPLPYQILGAKNWVLASNGIVQHPEIETMAVEDYDDFIRAPYETMLEKFLPRACAALDVDPINKALTLTKAYIAYSQAVGVTSGIARQMRQKYGYAPGIVRGNMLEAPFDFLADQLRGFKGISMDVRRCPDKVKAAVEAIIPLMLKQALATPVLPGTLDFIPLHLAPYLSDKVFKELYWPSLEYCITKLDKQGVGCRIFAENDWTRFAYALAELPKSTLVLFEDGDYSKIKKTVGRNHIIGGFYNPTKTLSMSEEECIEDVKRIVDVCMEGGRFYFSFDRSVMDINSIDTRKLQLVLEWVRDNAKY
ncbi:MAG: hypothetical protein LBT08_04200 [Synergistaceae bacterium]|jgi:hypothetical protein|nr:hypothetical protein [Synergistaceae bacterium]